MTYLSNRRPNLTVIALTAVLAASCAMEDGAELPEELTYDEFVAEFIEVTADEEGNEYLTYDDDLAVESWDEVKELYEDYSSISEDGEVAAQAVADRRGGGINRWTSQQARNLYYCFNSNVGSKLRQAVRAATRDWESIANVDFKEVNANGNCNRSNNFLVFNIRAVRAGSNGFAARAFFPNNARRQRELLINVDAYTASNNRFGSFPAQGVMRHELGHTLGLRHETARREIVGQRGQRCFESNYNSLVELTPPDLRSVMITPACLGADVRELNPRLTISTRDRQGIRQLY